MWVNIYINHKRMNFFFPKWQHQKQQVGLGNKFHWIHSTYRILPKVDAHQQASLPTDGITHVPQEDYRWYCKLVTYQKKYNTGCCKDSQISHHHLKHIPKVCTIFGNHSCHLMWYPTVTPSWTTSQQPKDTKSSVHLRKLYGAAKSSESQQKIYVF